MRQLAVAVGLAVVVTACGAAPAEESNARIGNLKHSPADDVALTRCEIGDSNKAVATLAITNNTSARVKDYGIHVTFEGADGIILDERAMHVDDVRPGQKLQREIHGSKVVRGHEFTCTVHQVCANDRRINRCSPWANVVVTGCEIDDSNTPVAKLEITNNRVEPSDYAIMVAFGTADGTPIDRGETQLRNVPSGGEVQDDVRGSKKLDASTAIMCKVLAVDPQPNARGLPSS